MDSDEEMKKAKMAAAEISFYLQSDFDDDTCTLASLQSDISKMSLKSAQQPRAQKPGAFWTTYHGEQEASSSHHNIPEETKEENDDYDTTPPRGSRLSAPQPADQDNFTSRRRQTITEARKTCQRVEQLLEAASDALEGTNQSNNAQAMPAGSAHSTASGPSTPPSTNLYQGFAAASAAASPAAVSPRKSSKDESISNKEAKSSSPVSPPRTMMLSKAPAPRIISTRTLMRAAAANSSIPSTRTLLSKEDQQQRRPAEAKVIETLAAPRQFNSFVSESSAGSSTIAAALPTVPVQRNVPVNRPIVPTTPGAFSIPGRNAPPTATVLHVEEIDPEVEENEEEDDDDEWNELDRILDVDEEEWNRLDKPNELKNQVVEANLVVAARLAADDEDSIHAQVRKSILEKTPRAAVVHVEHGGEAQKMEDPIREAMRRAELERYKPRGVKEKLFGDGKTAMLDIGTAPDDYIRKRVTMPFTVKQNETTGNWVCSVQTNQKAWEKCQRGDNSASANLDLMRSVKTFSASTEKAALEAGYAMAPPVMESFDENPICCLCKTKFAVFRRPHHCKNCGVVVCSSCACSWSSRRVPSTYNTAKKEKVIVCQACDWLGDNFQKAVMNGDLPRAQALHKTGNVNLRHPYGAWTKGGKEVFNPIHMSILGGNLDLVRWLIEEKCCPLRRRDKAKSLLCTSKGRSPIRLALTLENPEILRFLVSEQGMSLEAEDFRGDYKQLLVHLTTLLHTVPGPMLRPKEESSDRSISIDLDHLNASLPQFERAATTEERTIKKKEAEFRRGSF
ncbi:unnamed protein product [Cylindrotheca closterium]|uniref:FYVE-type domain-containing protein n=1 Tax=Cylindrotheca closterium TaxID=2856 RepID=A0AAD2G473_9STRA|nr:unnamed protein product [Cylindrotheca closterium]